MTLTTQQWAIFLTGAIACNPQGQRVADECPDTISAFHFAAKAFAAIGDKPVPDGISRELGDAFIHLVAEHDLPATEPENFPKTLPTFPIVAVQVYTYLETLV
jgi:hypothetical protein